MKILVTGAKGFIGKNLISELKNKGYTTIYEYDIGTPQYLLEEYCKKTDFIFHLAGVNRPREEKEFMEGNFGFTSQLLDLLKKNNNKASIMISSSIQAELDNSYGKSKKAGEDLILKYSEKYKIPVHIYRFPNVFGKWSKPNYNTVVATFCYNIARELPIQINNPDAQLTLVYIDDIVADLINLLNTKSNKGDNLLSPVTKTISLVYSITLGKLAELIYSFKQSRDSKQVVDMSDSFTKKLYSTYLSFLPESEFSYDLKMNIDQRGSFSEFLKYSDRGQVSVNISKPGITKGNHWHHTKTEKFLVVSGKGVIRFRRIDSEDIIEYFVSDDKLQVVDIPPGYTHNIENLGEVEMVTVMWANEEFDPQRPDTYYLEV